MSASTSPDARPVSAFANGDEFRPGGWSIRYVAIMAVLILLSENGWLQDLYPINAMPEIGAYFHTSQVAWIPTIYLLVAALLCPMIGTLADRFGKKRLLVFVLAVAIIGLLASAFAPDFAILLAGRVLQAPVLTLPFLLPSLARDIFPTRTIPMAASLAVTGSGVLGVPTQLLAGPVIEVLGWRGTFWISAIVAAAVLVLLLLIVPESGVRQRGGRIDVIGTLLLGGGVALILVGVSFGPSWGWESPLVLAGFTAGIVLLAAWIIQAGHVRHPVVDLRDLASAPVLLTMLLGGIGMAGSQWLITILPTLAVTPAAHGGLGISPVEQTQLSALIMLGSGLSGFLVGFALRKRSVGPVAIAIITVETAGLLLAYFGLHSIPLFVIAALIVGFGGAASITIGYNLVIRLAAKERQAATSSTIALFFNVFSGIVSVVLFAIMNSLSTPDRQTGTTAYNSAAFSAGTLIPVGLGIIAILAGIALHIKLKGRDIDPAQLQPAPEAASSDPSVDLMDR